MKLIGLLSWYDENPEWLRESIDSFPVDALVALDGAYQLFPAGSASSPVEQVRAIEAACEAKGIPLQLDQPHTKWRGNECEKRTALFALGNLLAEDGDWFCVIDADEVCEAVPGDLHRRLKGTTLDVAQVTFHEPGGRRERYPIRILFRAIPGLQVVGNHYTYLTPDGRKLWGPGRRSLEPALDLTDFAVLHRTAAREPIRQEAQRLYYDLRKHHGTELGVCCRCGAKATRVIASGWQQDEYGLWADYLDACDTHACEMEAENAKALESFGFDATGKIDPRLAAVR